MKKILIVEDDQDMNSILSEQIKNMGYKVINCFDADCALQKLNGSEVDLAILDYKLPKMTGLELLEILKSNYPEMKIFMISAHGDIKLKEKAKSLGVNDFLDKPFELNELESLVHEYLN